MGSLLPSSPVKSVAIIGAGPGGLAVAKYLLAEKAFSSVVIFEQRLSVGGVWNATPNETGVDRNFTVPRIKPTQLPNDAVGVHKGKDGKYEFQFPSPVYDDLDTNIPHDIMRYSDFPFPQGCSLFPHHEVVLAYLLSYAEDIKEHIYFGRQVVQVRRENGRWTVAWRSPGDSTSPGSNREDIFDAVIVANGHYDDPFIPDIPRIEEFQAKYPTSITHSKFYRRPDVYKNQKVIVVGHNASGLDISNQVAPFCSHPLIISVKAGDPIPPTTDSSIRFVPEIKEFTPESRSVQFSDGSVENDIDSVIFCTGYMYSYPFLSGLDPPVVTTGERTLNLYHQLFYRPDPTLSFIALPQRIVPFPISESQGAVIARVLSGRLLLPSEDEMLSWEQKRVAEKGDGKPFHILGYPADAQYINYFHDWALQAEKRPELYGGDGVGKRAPYWGEKECWIRERIPLIKEAARKLGKDRGKVKTLEELGFDFEAWKKEQVRKDNIL